jgi:hypothetical protein
MEGSKGIKRGQEEQRNIERRKERRGESERE